MKGVLFINGYYISESEIYRCERLQKEFSLLDVKTIIFKNNVPLQKEFFSDVDFCLFFDKDYFSCRLIESWGVRVFNNSDVLEITDNKNGTYAFLAERGVEMPVTVLAPKKFFYVQDREYLDAVSSVLGFPLVMKEACGSLGKQVYLIHNKEELYRMDEETGTVDKQFQSFEKDSFGKSVRVICIGGRAIGAMELFSEGDFRSNAYLGGEGKVFSLTSEYKKRAEEVAGYLGADYCGIDFFINKPVLIEVNGNAYFSQFEQVTGINVAQKYARYILESFSPRDGIR